MIKVEIVKDSVAPNGSRLTTYVLTYPRFIHSEFMTHRMFSRNASSSRAIPVAKQIQMVLDNPAIPLAFTKNKPGMQGGEALTGTDHSQAVASWLYSRDHAVRAAEEMASLGVHKQYANRIIEPFSHITVVCSATEYANFFALRLHPAAQPEICELARQMWEAYETNEPELLDEGDWHLPFVTPENAKEEIEEYLANNPSAEFIDFAIRMSVARCARVSYLNHDGKKSTVEEDLKLYDRLLGQLPIHASPAEHQAMAMSMYSRNAPSGNFRGWIQYRKTLENENITRFDGPKDGTQS